MAANKLVLLGVTQEQHAERCVLFAKWKKFDFTILHDPINSLECRAVPITIAIDEDGIVKSTKPTEDWLRNEFIDSTINEPLKKNEFDPEGEIANWTQLSESRDKGHFGLGDTLMLWRPKVHDQAVNAYARSLKTYDIAKVHFRLGVALRKRFDSPEGTPGDFRDAVAHWTTALQMDPNQYIYRRRIQQYGPRLDKPYPFYDWVDDALADLSKRGDDFKLSVRLSGAEIAKPERNSRHEAKAFTHPDPDGKITRDVEPSVKISSTVVPSSQEDSDAIRLHLQFEPGTADWNNEAGPMQIWFERSDAYATSTSLIEYRPTVTAVESREKRAVEAEFTLESGISPTIRGFALYYVCEKSTGQCIFRRQDFVVPTKIE